MTIKTPDKANKLKCFHIHFELMGPVMSRGVSGGSAVDSAAINYSARVMFSFVLTFDYNWKLFDMY